jgi:predicted nucleotidyltransferase
MDADVVLSGGMRKAEILANVFKEAGFAATLTSGDFDDPIPGLLKLHDTFDNRVDLLVGLRGMESLAFARLVEVPFQGKILKFIGREDFIAMKVYAGGPMDLIDAARAISAAGGVLDLDLLRQLAKRYGGDAPALLDRLLRAD